MWAEEPQLFKTWVQKRGQYSRAVQKSIFITQTPAFVHTSTNSLHNSPHHWTGALCIFCPRSRDTPCRHGIRAEMGPLMSSLKNDAAMRTVLSTGTSSCIRRHWWSARFVATFCSSRTELITHLSSSRLSHISMAVVQRPGSFKTRLADSLLTASAFWLSAVEAFTLCWKCRTMARASARACLTVSTQSPSRTQSFRACPAQSSGAHPFGRLPGGGWLGPANSCWYSWSMAIFSCPWTQIHWGCHARHRKRSSLEAGTRRGLLSKCPQSSLALSQKGFLWILLSVGSQAHNEPGASESRQNARWL